jgi:hypothetical protein
MSHRSHLPTRARKRGADTGSPSDRVAAEDSIWRRNRGCGDLILMLALVVAVLIGALVLMIRCSV